MIAHFRGGPLDGEVRRMPDARHQWEFPVAPRISWVEAAAQANQLVVPETVTYRRGVRWTVGDADHAIFDHRS